MPKKIVFHGVEYRATIGRSHVKIVSDGGSYAPPCFEVKACWPETFERGRWKRTSDAAITPAEIVRWIRKNSWRFTTMKKEPVLKLRSPHYSDIISFTAPNGVHSECGIQVWVFGSEAGSEMPHRYVVMMTELEDNPGMSVTNAGDYVANEVTKTLLPNADPDLIVWLEHYPPRGTSSFPSPESFDRVFFRYDGQRWHYDSANQHPWKRLNADDLKALGILW
jgi:hypothetical protein